MKWVKAPEELKARIESLMQAVDSKTAHVRLTRVLHQQEHVCRPFPGQAFLPSLSRTGYVRSGKAFPTLSNLEPMPGPPYEGLLRHSREALPGRPKDGNGSGRRRGLVPQPAGKDQKAKEENNEIEERRRRPVCGGIWRGLVLLAPRCWAYAVGLIFTSPLNFR